MVVDTSVLIAGIAAFKGPFYQPRQNASADVLHSWVEDGSFVWLTAAEVVEEYREIALQHGIRRFVIGRILNLLQEEAERISIVATHGISPDTDDDCFCQCAQDGRAGYIVTLNPKDFPQKLLSARVLSPVELLKILRPRKRS